MSIQINEIWFPDYTHSQHANQGQSIVKVVITLASLFLLLKHGAEEYIVIYMV